MKFAQKLLPIALSVMVMPAVAGKFTNFKSFKNKNNFVRVASFPICSQIDPTCNTDTETAAEIVAVSSDGMTLVYSDSPANQVGFVDITAPSQPLADGTVDLVGEPTSVAVKGDFALVGINTSEDFVNVSGQLDIVNIETRTVVHSIDLGGQPDSVAVSPDGNFAAIVLENERDEDLNDGELPQLPAGGLVVVDISDADPENWQASTVELTGLADKAPEDPEPEYVDINDDNIAVITFQENNHLALVDLANGTVINDFSAGAVDLKKIDATEEDPAIISLTETQNNVVREPDGVAWIGTRFFATADEGDLDGGSRGFTIFNTDGDIVWTSGNSLDHMAVRLGHYPDDRSGNKGNEPENVEFGIFGKEKLLFVNSERSSLVFVYDVANPTRPKFKQVLPAGAGPEGGLAIPSRNLLVVASEEDDRGDKIRSVLNIYNYDRQPSAYPTLQSLNRFDGTPIPWGAMSGLAADRRINSRLYAIEDSFYGANRIFAISTIGGKARLTRDIKIRDLRGVFANFPTSGATEDPDSFDAVDLQALINDDKTVNIDPEGIAQAYDRGFWIASEGRGTVTDTTRRPIESLNFIFKTNVFGIIQDVITLPEEVNAIQVRFGFEGIAQEGAKLYVVIQRAWGGEENPRIGIYDLRTKSWQFVFYPLDEVESQNGGWVGLSDITSLGGGEFLIVERDNQGGPDAAIKRLYQVNLSNIVEGETVSKTLVRDLIDDLAAPGGLIYEKIEGSAVTRRGDVFIINDNDGVDDNSGETQLINLGKILK